MKRAVFLDRDGTIIRDANYLDDPEKVVVLPGASRALALLREHGFALFMLTNQSGVGRGLFPMETVHRCNERMLDLLGLGRDLFTEIGIAPEHPDNPQNDGYRKPSPRFINECVDRYDLSRHSSWMVGDKESDIQCGRNAGIQSAMVGCADCAPRESGSTCFESLWAFSRWLTDRGS